MTACLDPQGPHWHLCEPTTTVHANHAPVMAPPAVAATPTKESIVLYGQCPTILEDGTQCPRSVNHKSECRPLRKQRKAAMVAAAAARKAPKRRAVRRRAPARIPRARRPDGTFMTRAEQFAALVVETPQPEPRSTRKSRAAKARKVRVLPQVEVARVVAAPARRTRRARKVAA